MGGKGMGNFNQLCHKFVCLRLYSKPLYIAKILQRTAPYGKKAKIIQIEYQCWSMIQFYIKFLLEWLPADNKKALKSQQHILCAEFGWKNLLLRCDLLQNIQFGKEKKKKKNNPRQNLFNIKPISIQFAIQCIE